MGDSEEIAAKGISALQDAIFQNYKHGRQEWLPRRYRIDGFEFEIVTYLNLIDDNDEMGLHFLFPVRMDPADDEHMAAVRAAIWLHHQIDYLNGVLMFVGEDGIYDGIHQDTTEDMLKYYHRVVGLQDLYIYPYLPSSLWFQISDCRHRVAYFWQQAGLREAAKQQQAMRASPKHGFVYLIQSSTGSYKIGRTKDPDDRIRTFNVKLPFEVDYVCTIESADMYALERQLHNQYASKRINGEWFMLDAADVAAIQNMAVQS